MKTEAISFMEWQKRFGSNEACMHYLAQQRWSEGFQCPRCGHDHGYLIQPRCLYECAQCRYQASVTAGTVFHSTNLPLTKWFWAIYLMTSDKGGISAMRLSKLLDVSWPTARAMLQKLRTAMAHRDSLYRLTERVELDDALVGGKRPGKRGRGAAGKTAVLVACEAHDGRAGYLAMQAVAGVTGKTVSDFARHRLSPDSRIRTDALHALNTLGEEFVHQARKTPPEQASAWLPWVHIAIANLKRFLLGTFHGVSAKYLQEYLDEFCYRFNRRHWEPQLPLRLLHLCIDHSPITFA